MVDVEDVAIVGGGPAGAALAIRLASAGLRTVVLERAAQPAWRPCGVFSSPLTRLRLVELGLTRDRLVELTRPISALNLETTRGATCRIEYERGLASGYDRVRLDAALLEGARSGGVDVRSGTVVRAVTLPVAPGGLVRLTVSPTRPENAETHVINARLVVGADGSTSLVARAAGVFVRPTRRLKSGVTFHRLDPDAAPEGRPMEGRFVFGHGWYVGVAPVPGRRVNVGIVLPRGWLAGGPELVSERLLSALPGPRNGWMSAPISDGYAVAGALEHRVARTTGAGYVLVGDAAGFIDPLTGEGLHRALVSSELAADAIVKWARGDHSALDDYDRHLRSRFRSKDVLSWVLQAFLAQPALFGYALRRLAARHRQRQKLTLVLTDQLPATQVLDPRYLARLLAP